MTRRACRPSRLVLVALLPLVAALSPGRLAAAQASCPATGGPPTVTQVLNNHGTTTGTTGGGDFAGIQGLDFCTTIFAVYFGTSPAASWVVDDDQHMSAISPAHAAGVVDVTVAAATGLSATSTADQFTFVTDAPSVYVPITPKRVLDTRITPQGPNATVFLGLYSQGVPTNAVGVAINVTVTNTATAGALTVFAGGGVHPLSSNLNWSAGETVANLVMVGIGDPNGSVYLYGWQFGHADLVVDLEGYFVPPGGGTAGEFVALAPSRITDTRHGSGQPNAGSTLGPASSLDVQVTGVGGVPATGVSAVVLNATATNTTTSGFLTAYPTGASVPLASNINWTAGRTVPNRVVVPVGAGGKVSFFNGAGSADLVVDVNGYFTDSTAAGSSFRPLHPEILFLHPRILDTRYSQALGPGGSIALTVAGQGGIPLLGGPSSPTSVVIDVTVTDTTAAGALTVWPDGATRPLTSDLNWTRGSTVPNLVVVQLGSNGKIDLYNYAGSADVIVDVMGWFG